MNTAQRAGVRTLKGLLCLLGLACFSLFQSTTAWASDAQTVVLDYKEAREGVGTWSLIFQPEKKPFAKEPKEVGRNVIRGSLVVGGAENEGVPILWDPRQGKLHVDANRNRDLTDDPAYAVSPQKGFNYQVFTDVRFQFKTAKGLAPILADLRLYNPGAGRVTGNVICRSFWQGKFSANGRDWQVGRIDTESRSFGLANKGYLLLRPWEERNRPIEFQNGMLDAFEFAPNLFFGGEAYKLDCTWIDQQGEPKYQLSFQPTNCALGELKLTGKFIHRLVLTASRGGRPLDRLNAVLDNPQESVRIPAGDYEYLHVQLRSGSTQAYRERYVNFAKRQRLTVGATTGDSAATLAAGGPLTNSVSVTRQGRSLSLRYQLLGADGVPYVIAGVVNRSNPPRFVVSKDGKQIHSGRFEFG